MKISYLDGFTEELIKFTAQNKGDSWKVEASWFSLKKDGRVPSAVFKLPRDLKKTDELMQNLVALNESYELTIDDLSSHNVTFTLEGKKYSRSFNGLGNFLYKEFPELKGKINYLVEVCDEIREEIKKYSNQTSVVDAKDAQHNQALATNKGYL